MNTSVLEPLIAESQVVLTYYQLNRGLSDLEVKELFKRVANEIEYLKREAAHYQYQFIKLQDEQEQIAP